MKAATEDHGIWTNSHENILFHKSDLLFIFGIVKVGTGSFFSSLS